ncbi:hypothetical protein JL720_8251 [Aureococcus anophagefferens]|nr:hypothetical protein JL720_8251 [Aureococcus anophagefferens]
MLRRVAPLLAAAAASAWTNLGPCGANGRWGETVEEKIFFLKTIKTAGSTTRSQRWVDAKRFSAVGAAAAAGRARYDVALDHATLDAQALATYLPGARWVTVSRDVPSRVVSAIAMFRGDMSPATTFRAARRSTAASAAASPSSGRACPKRAHLELRGLAARRARRGAPIDFARPQRPSSASADASALVDLVEGNHSGAFALVMLTERYDESLVLLRSIFCWRWMDLLTQQPPVAPVQQDRRNRQEKHDRPKSVKAPEVYKAKKTHPFHFAKVFEGKKKDDRNAKQRKRARAPAARLARPGGHAAFERTHAAERRRVKAGDEAPFRRSRRSRARRKLQTVAFDEEERKLRDDAAEMRSAVSSLEAWREERRRETAALEARSPPIEPGGGRLGDARGDGL